MAKKILVVDDEPDLLKVTLLRLKKTGYEVFGAVDGREALDLARRIIPDLIILDIYLPLINGDEVAKRLKKDDGLKHIPIILISATTRSLAERAKDSGACGYLTKPFEPEELVGVAKKILGKKEAFSMDKKKILVIDDEADFLEMMKIRLEANNYEVITALNGKEGLEKVKQEKPDAVLLDILMPGHDGLRVLRRIRSHNKKLPVFIITAFSDEEKFKLANKLDASGFIVKTSDLKQEVDNINSILNISLQYKVKK